MLVYSRLVAAAVSYGERLDQFLRTELPHVWLDAYHEMTPGRATNISVIPGGTFEYIYDDHDTLEATGVVPRDSVSESRLIAVIGTSEPNSKRRDDYRLRGWVGPTEKNFREGMG